MIDNRSSDGGPLYLPATQFVWVTMGFMTEFKQCQHVLDTRIIYPSAGETLGDLQIFLYGKAFHQVCFLENQPDTLATIGVQFPRREIIEFLAINQHRARLRLE